MTTERIAEPRSLVSTGDLESAPAERETAPEVSSRGRGLQSILVTVRDRLILAMGRSRAYWVPPRFLTEPPATVAEMTAYARRAGWTRHDSGLLRRLGILWCLLVAVPAAAYHEFRRWIVERPGRFLLALAVWEIAIRSAPGVWTADHLIRPILAAAAWVFLP